MYVGPAATLTGLTQAGSTASTRVHYTLDRWPESRNEVSCTHEILSSGQGDATICMSRETSTPAGSMYPYAMIWGRAGDYVWVEIVCQPGAYNKLPHLAVALDPSVPVPLPRLRPIAWSPRATRKNSSNLMAGQMMSNTSNPSNPLT
ncbi:hypothetical protein HD554DRAFT_2039264 [Boletus coccyginus]|nr:hypothetical protein HD554DRAFT_2039264 [Boletus coccyginus]